MGQTFYWHDYETSGVDPRLDRPMQFAGVRTDEELNEIDEPLLIYCRPAADCLPRPEACLLTGISPQLAWERGLCEAEFIARIHEQMIRPKTCSVGYNSLRFDDEVTRHTLYRNFFDPYAREWRNGNSRWDIIDLARMCYALRPDGLAWPSDEQGRPSFRLERLTAANGIEHQGAHDALADVRATIALARLLRQAQPKLFDWLMSLRRKQAVNALLSLKEPRILVHTTRMYPAEVGCTSLIWPLAPEPSNQSGILVFDLRQDPRSFFDLPVEALQQSLFTPAGERADDLVRLPVKAVRNNRCPALAPLSVLDDDSCQRIAIDRERCQRHAQLLAGNPSFALKVAEAYQRDEGFPVATDVDAALYEGFLDDDDRRLCDQVRERTAEQLLGWQPAFHDPRLTELLFRYRARNWPEALNEDEQRRWQADCRQRLSVGNGRLTLPDYLQHIDRLSQTFQDAESTRMLADLRRWGEDIGQSLGMA